MKLSKHLQNCAGTCGSSRTSDWFVIPNKAYRLHEPHKQSPKLKRSTREVLSPFLWRPAPKLQFSRPAFSATLTAANNGWNNNPLEAKIASTCCQTHPSVSETETSPNVPELTMRIFAQRTSSSLSDGSQILKRRQLDRC